MRLRKWLGKPNPDYGYEIKGFTFSRFAMELLINGLFLIMGTSIARSLIEKLPLVLLVKYSKEQEPSGKNQHTKSNEKNSIKA